MEASFEFISTMDCREFAFVFFLALTFSRIQSFKDIVVSKISAI